MFAGDLKKQKLNFGHYDQFYVWRKKGMYFNLKNCEAWGGIINILGVICRNKD